MLPHSGDMHVENACLLVMQQASQSDTYAVSVLLDMHADADAA